MLDNNTVITLTQKYAEVVKKEFSPFAIVLFGSYAKNNANDESDIDVGIIFNGFTGDWFTTSRRLWNLAYDISWDIEPHILDRTKDKSGFVEHVMKTGEIIHQS